MWRSATSSDRRRTRGRSLRPGLALVLLSAAALWPGSAAGKVFLSTDEALRLAFPDCALERRTVFLTAAQLRRARELAGVEIKGALVNPYRATRGGQLIGTAYFDAHVVRTQPETVMVVVDPQGRVARIEVLSFAEPEDYLPRGPWYGQFVGRSLTEDLNLQRAIRSVAGASLTARATTAAVRRVLAINQTLGETPP